MKFAVRINKHWIYYFYINNLALEDKKFWVRRNYNQEFISSTGPLTPLEKKTLSKYQKTILRLEKGRLSTNLADFFYRQDPWRPLKKAINIKDFGLIFRTFQLFKERFNLFWDDKLKNEGVIGKKELVRNIRKNKQYIEKIINDLKILYSPTSSLLEMVYIFLVPLPGIMIKGGGGKFIPSAKGLSVEGSSARMATSRTIEIILHELIHLCFENGYRKKLLKFIKANLSRARQNKLTQSLNIPSVEFGIREIIATSLTIRAAPINKFASAYQKLLFYASKKLQPLISRYVKEKKPFDEKFTKEVLKIWQFYLKNNGHSLSNRLPVYK